MVRDGWGEERSSQLGVVIQTDPAIPGRVSSEEEKAKVPIKSPGKMNPNEVPEGRNWPASCKT